MTTLLPLDYGACKPVIAYIYPDTRATVERLWLERPHALYENAWLGAQDKAHLALLADWSEWASPVLAIPARLKHRYVTSGSTEAIRESIAQYALRAPGGRLHIFDGEYEGYAAYAGGYGLNVVRHARHGWGRVAHDMQPGELFYISQPSAIDGRVWGDLDAFCETLSGARLVTSLMLDVSYVGAVAREYEVRTEHPALHSVFFSLSKPFGIYYHRIGGVFSSTPMPGLEGNVWFKNVFSIVLARRLLAATTPHSLPRKYLAQQHQATDLLRQSGLLFTPADVFMLATAPGDRVPAGWLPLVRGPASEPVVRACLTPALASLDA